MYIIPWYTHTHTHTHREPRTLVAEQMYLGMPRCYARTRVVAWGSGAGLLAPCVCLLRWCAFSFFFWFLVCVGSLCVSGPCVCVLGAFSTVSLYLCIDRYVVCVCVLGWCDFSTVSLYTYIDRYSVCVYVHSQQSLFIFIFYFLYIYRYR